jgi:hypothetical protein
MAKNRLMQLPKRLTMVVEVGETKLRLESMIIQMAKIMTNLKPLGIKM